MIKIKVSGQVEYKILPHNTTVLVGNKWFNTSLFIMDVKPGDNVLIDSYWYTIESVEWIK